MIVFFLHSVLVFISRWKENMKRHDNETNCLLSSQCCRFHFKMRRKHETSWVVGLNFEGWVFGLYWKSCTGLPNWDATASTLEKSRGLAQIELHAGAALQLDLRLLRVCMLCCSLWNASYESHWRARLSFAGLSFARCTRAAVLEVPCARFRFPLPTTTAREALKDTDARGFKLESEFLSIQSTRRYFLKK